MDRLAADEHMLQDPWEFSSFCGLLMREGVRSYLEIGSWSGGSIEMVAKYLPKGSSIVSVDLPTIASKYQKLQQVLAELYRDGYKTFLCTGPSGDEETIHMATMLGPYDAVFIDGSHTFEGVKSDWENYGKLGTIVGFHDIAVDSPGHGVARFWKQLKAEHRHCEFISEETRKQNIGYGIGVVWNGSSP